MGKKLRFLMVAAVIALFSTSAMAQDNAQSDKSEKRVSANGSYQFKPSWGIGLQYGMTFTDMDNWNDNLLLPARMNYFDVNFIAEHELYIEVTPVEGFRLSAFGGWQNLYITDTGFSYAYGGLEPAFSVRRSFYEFAVGIGVGYGKSWLDSKAHDMDGHGLMLRPFIEARFYPCDIFALYLRVAFSYYKEFGLEKPGKDTYAGLRDLDDKIDVDKLSHAGPNVAVGFRFGSYATPKIVIGDSDEDGVLDDIDECKDVSGDEAFYGCPNPDPDGDGVCEPWVAEHGDVFAKICTGTDECPDLPGSAANNGCPNPDTDADGYCDPWVSEGGYGEKYASVCRDVDKCPGDGEDMDGFEDADGCPDPDNDGDGMCDPWVADTNAFDKYENVCSKRDICPNIKGYEQFNGCPAPDTDGDGYCDAWVYKENLNSFFGCKGLDECPNEKGDDDKGCEVKRVVVTAEKIQINEKIFFNLNKSTIKKESDSLLEEIAQVLKDNPQIKKVEIQGHSDTSGNAKKNLKLSSDRAKAVRDRLIKNGVEADRMTFKGYGSTQLLIPLEPGQKKETEEQAAANRRVEFVILEQDAVQKVVEVPKDGSKPAATTPAPKTATNPAPKASDDKAKSGSDKAKSGSDKAKSATDKAKADAKAANDKAKSATDKAKADAKAANDKAKAATDKAKADAKAANDKAKAATDKAKADAKAANDKAKAATDKAKADAKAANDKAKADAKAANDKAKADAKTANDKASKAAKDAAAAKAAAAAAAKAAAGKK